MQLVIVGCCVCLAAVFMLLRLRSALRRKGCAGCKNRGGECGACANAGRPLCEIRPGLRPR